MSTIYEAIKQLNKKPIKESKNLKEDVESKFGNEVTSWEEFKKIRDENNADWFNTKSGEYYFNTTIKNGSKIYFNPEKKIMSIVGKGMSQSFDTDDLPVKLSEGCFNCNEEVNSKFGNEVKSWEEFEKIRNENNADWFPGKSGKFYFDINIKNGSKIYFNPEKKIMSIVGNGITQSFDINDLPVKINEECRNCNEDFESSKPVETLDEDQVINIVKGIRSGTFFKLGVMSEVMPSSQYRGGRGSDGNPYVRIVKCSEMYVATGEDHENQKETQERRAAGIERTTRSSGFSMSTDPQLSLKIFNGPKGEALSYFPRRGSIPKVKYFISLDNGDLEPATKQDVAQYLTPSAASAILGDREVNPDQMASAPTKKVYISNIYMIGNVGHSVM